MTEFSDQMRLDLDIEQEIEALALGKPIDTGVHVYNNRVIPFRVVNIPNDDIPTDIVEIGGTIFVSSKLDKNGPPNANPPTQIQRIDKYLQEKTNFRKSSGNPWGPNRSSLSSREVSAQIAAANIRAIGQLTLFED